MAHPRLMHVKDRLLSAIRGAAPGSLVLVLGPTGVGKTTLRLKCEQVLTAEMMAALQCDPGQLPFVSVEAVASLTGSFNWRDHFSRMLRGMDEPLIADKLNGQRIGGERSPTGRYTPVPRAAAFELQHAVEQALSHRRPAAVFVDEAQHLGRIASGRKLSDQLDVIKSIANRTQTVHVLFGTYDLLSFRNLSCQLSGGVWMSTSRGTVPITRTSWKPSRTFFGHFRVSCRFRPSILCRLGISYMSAPWVVWAFSRNGCCGR
jgi:energy-coupling factor transporter ATP-binding protein EcfA2